MPFGTVFGQYDRCIHGSRISNYLKINMYLICIFRLFFFDAQVAFAFFIVESARVAVERKLGVNSRKPVDRMRIFVPCWSQAGPRDMGSAEGTVKLHVRHLLTSLNQRTLVEAAAWAGRRRRQPKP